MGNPFYYIVTISESITLDNDKVKTIKNQYLISAYSVEEASIKAHKYMENMGSRTFKVTSITQSRISDIIVD